MELPRPRSLTMLTIYELIGSNDLINGALATASDSTDIEIYKGGYWIKIYDDISLGDGVTSFDMYGVECSRIRITFENTRLFDNESTPRSARISEITCTAANDPIDYTEMVAALDRFPISAIKSNAYKKFTGYVLDIKATQSEIDAYTSEINEYCKMIGNVSFVPMSSITLGSELVYNIYVPVSDSLISYTVNGVTYENAEKAILDDGNSYYRITVSMAAPEAARDIVLEACVNIDGKSYIGTWTMSIPKYAQRVIESGTPEEITLVKDVLSYIKAAYTYFDADNKNDVIAVIDGILGDYEAEFETVTGNTNTDAGLKAVIIALKENPVIRFVLPEGKTAEAYKFKSKNQTLNYKTGSVSIDGKEHIYVEVQLYAYQLIKEISYTDGEYSGSYHINSYYEFITSDEAYKNNAELISLVEKLYIYAKSAEAYRASV